jgi:hypothetical protein
MFGLNARLILAFLHSQSHPRFRNEWRQGNSPHLIALTKFREGLPPEDQNPFESVGPPGGGADTSIMSMAAVLQPIGRDNVTALGRLTAGGVARGRPNHTI